MHAIISVFSLPYNQGSIRPGEDDLQWLSQNTAQRLEGCLFYRNRALLR